MNLTWSIYILILVSVNVIGAIRWKVLAKGEKIMAILMLITLISEPIALFANIRLRNNLPVYHIFNPIEFLLISLYFNCSLRYFRKKNIGLIAGITGVVLSVLNTLFIQRITTINSFFLLFEGTAIIIYCLLSIHQLLLNEEHLPYRFAHFWITLCCLIYWSSTFTGWGLYAILSISDGAVLTYFSMILTAANFIFYLGIATTLVLYKRLIPTVCA
jgi:hypothetical protein